MQSAGQSSLATSIAGALDWWREAGVDADFSDTPQAWLSETEAAPNTPQRAAVVAPPAPPPVRIGGDAAGFPRALAAFAAWWLAEPSLDAGRTEDRVPPRGPADAALMVLVAHPEAEDRERLLSGPQGKLLDAMLRAMGIAPEAAYVASALPRHAPHPDWTALARDGLGEVLTHHIALAAPQRLIVFGANILPLLGHDPANSGGNSPGFNHEGRTMPLLPAMELGVLGANPRRKASFWQRWLEWTGTDAG
ncbi:MAG: hypothetical protein ACREBO_09440 [Novosphingobium sp.]